MITGIFGAFTAAGGVLLGNGCSNLAGLKRRSKYIRALGDHTYCDFRNLSLAVGKPVKFVKRDIKKMIDKGWFLQGHVDTQETCLITSNETYDQYVSTQKQLEERKRQDEERAMRQNFKSRQMQKPGRKLRQKKENGQRFPRRYSWFWIKAMTFWRRFAAATMPFQEKKSPGRSPEWS